jgi:putative two-component system response regulator
MEMAAPRLGTLPYALPHHTAQGGRPRVLLVDDLPVNLRLMRALLAEVDCEVETANDGPEAIAKVEANPPALVLLDLDMPSMSGFEVCRRIKSSPLTRLVPVVMVTALSAVTDRIEALEAGADDFLSKPVDRAEMLARVTSLLRLRKLYDELDESERVIFALAAAVEAKDQYTEAHTERVAESAYELGRRAGLAGPQLRSLYRGGMIHDIGKIGVPDAILHKAGRLSRGEWDVMRRHPQVGEAIARPLRSAAGLLGIIRHHHENFSGGGYPDGLSGLDIPIEARVMAVCDAMDAMMSDRPYRLRRTYEEAIAILKDGAGMQWDPELVRLFTRDVAGTLGYDR